VAARMVEAQPPGGQRALYADRKQRRVLAREAPKDETGLDEIRRGVIVLR
jgi:hypothetical protein